MSAEAQAAPPTTPAAPRVRSERVRLLRVFGGNRIAVFGLALAILVMLAAIGAPLITPLDPFEQSAANRMDGPDAVHFMGRDTFGRDIFARVLYAGRVSLLVGVLSVALGGVVGTLLGLIAGYSGRWLENLVMRAVDVLMAFKAREFVEAARCLGAGQSRIVGRHILPNLSGETIVLASLLTASAIRIEASLSFIGLGVSPPTPTWGNMIRDGAPLLLNSPWLSVFPGLAILVTVLAFNLMGDGLRDVLDPRSQQ